MRELEDDGTIIYAPGSSSPEPSRTEIPLQWQFGCLLWSLACSVWGLLCTAVLRRTVTYEMHCYAAQAVLQAMQRPIRNSTLDENLCVLLALFMSTYVR